MHRGDPCKAWIIRVHGSHHRRETRQEPFDGQIRFIGAAEEALDLGPQAHSESCTLPLDQRRAPKEHTVLGAGNTQVPWWYSLQTPDLMHMAA